MSDTLKNPYVGARTFETKESELFFGREREALDLLSLVISDRLVLFYAQSGAGKSSLINTKLIPGLIEENEFKILPVGRLRRDELVGSEASKKNIYSYNLITSLAKRSLDESILSKMSLSDYMELEVGEKIDDQNPWKYVLIIDQFEELFTTHEEEWEKREDFFKQLAEAMKKFPRVWVVLVMREDYIAYLDPYAYLLPDRLRTRYYMQRLDKERAIEAVEGPAGVGEPKRYYAPGVARRLVSELSNIMVRKPNNTWEPQEGQYVEPVQLQVVCSSLWEKLPSHIVEITQKELDEHVGEINKALGNFYEERVRTVSNGRKAKEKGVRERDIRKWFEEELIIDGKRRNMVAQEPGGKSGGLDDEVIQEFIGGLVREEKRSGGATFYELTHDRMVEPIIENNKEWFSVHSSLLQQQSALWIQQGRSNALLLRGRALREAGNETEAPELTKDEHAFLTASRVSERNRTIAWVMTGVTVIAMAILSFLALQSSKQAQIQQQIAEANAKRAKDSAFLADQNRQKAEENAALAQASEEKALAAIQKAESAQRIAEAQRSAARAQILQARPGQLYNSTLLAIDSWQTTRSEEAEGILRKNLSLLPIPVSQITQSGAISSVEFSPDGHTFVTASLDGTACVWQVQDRKELFCATTPGFVNDAAFSPDGKLVITGEAIGDVPGDQSGQVQILDAETGAIQQKFKYDAPVTDVNIKSDGQLLAVVRENGQIDLINLITRTQNYHVETSQKLKVAAFSPNGLWVAIGSSQGGIVQWNLANGKIFSSFKHNGEVLKILFSPNSQLLLSGGRDGLVIITNPATGQEQRILLADRVEDIAFSPDGSWFVTASADKRIRVWDTLSHTERLSMLQDALVNQVQVSPDGQWIATTGSDKTVRVWNASTGAEIFQIPIRGNGSALAFSNDGQYLLSGDETGELNTWDISAIPLPVKHIQFEGFVANAQYSPSGQQIAVSEENRVWLLDSKSLSGLTTRSQGTPTHQFLSTVRDIIFSPDSKILGIATERNEVLLYKTDRSGSSRIIISSPSPFQALAFSPDSSQFITGSSDGKVQVWDVATGKLVETWLENNESVTSLAVSPVSIAVGLKDKVLLLDIKTGSQVNEIENLGISQLMAFNVDGTLLAVSSSTGQINIWKQENSKFVRSSIISGEPAFSMAFNPTGDRLAVGTATEVYLRDANTGEESTRIPHPDNVNDVSFSADGNTLITVSSKILQFWDIAKLPQIRSDDLVSTACSHLIENFDIAQWSALFGGQKYRKLCENLPVPEE